jgi:hypothetical protein
MDSKNVPLTSYDDEPVPPPSYNETISPSSSNAHAYPGSSTSQYYSAQIRDQLHSLAQQISSQQAQRSLLHEANDERILALLAAEMQLFFSGFATSGSLRGALILVPGHVVQEGATPMEYDFRDQAEYDRVARVSGKGEEHVSGEWYWRDERMAERLARYLNPTPVVKKLPARGDYSSSDEEGPSRKVFVKNTKGAVRRREKTTVVTENNAPEQTRSRKFFGFGKKGLVKSDEGTPVIEESKVVEQAPVGAVRKKAFVRRKDIAQYMQNRDWKVHPDAKVGSTGSGDNVLMDVKAEEVSFRTENDFGIFETQRGWAIVLKLKVELDRS